MKPKVLKRKFQNKDGSYRESEEYYIRYTLNGKLKYENTHKKTREEANQYKAEHPIKYDGMNPKIEKDSLLDYLTKNGWLVIDTNPLYKAFQQNLKHGIQERTAYHMANDFSRLIESDDRILYYPYQRITRKESFEFRERLANDTEFFVSMANKNQLLNFLRTVYSYIIRKQSEPIINENPFSARIIDRFQYKDIQKNKYVFKPYEIREMFDDANIERITPSPDICSIREWNTLKKHFLKIYKWLAYTGMRISECLATTVSQVDSHILNINRAYKDPNQRVIRHPKTDEDRIIVLSQCAYDLIKTDLQTKNGSDLIFTNSFGKMAHSSCPTYYFQIFKKVIVKYLGIGADMKPNEYMCLHSFRKSFNTNLIEYGQGLKESYIAAYCGWSTSKGAEMAPVQATNYTESQLNSLYLVACEVDRIYSNKKMTWAPQLLSTNRLLIKEKKAILYRDSDLVSIIKFQRILYDALNIVMKGTLNSSDTTYPRYETEFTKIINNIENYTYDDFSQIPLVDIKKVFNYSEEKCKEIDMLYKSILKRLEIKKEFEERLNSFDESDPNNYDLDPDSYRYIGNSSMEEVDY